MGFPRKILRHMFDKGGILTIGVLSLMMSKKFKLPDLMGTLAYGVTAVGAYGFMRYLMDFDTSNTDKNFEEFINDLEKVKTVFEEKKRSEEELRDACQRFMNMRTVLEGLNIDMERIEEKMVVLNLLQKSIWNSELSSGVNTTEAVKQSDNVSESSIDYSEDHNVPESCIDISEDNTIDQGHVLPPQTEIVQQKKNKDLLDEKIPKPHVETSGTSSEMVGKLKDESLKMIEELQEAAGEPLLETVKKHQILGIDSPFEEVEKQYEEETERLLKDEIPIDLDTVVEKEYEML